MKNVLSKDATVSELGGDLLDEKIELLLNGQQYKKFQEVFYCDIVSQYGISVIDIRVLLFFYEHKSCDTAKDIVQNHFLTKSYVSKSVDRLIDRGYLERRHFKEDRRYIHLVVLDNAMPVIKLIQEKRKKMICKLLEGVQKEELEVLKDIAYKMSDNITEILADKDALENDM